MSESTHDVPDVNVLQFGTVVDKSSDCLAELFLVPFIQSNRARNAVPNLENIQVRTALPDLLEQLQPTTQFSLKGLQPNSGTCINKR